VDIWQPALSHEERRGMITSDEDNVAGSLDLLKRYDHQISLRDAAGLG